MVHIFIAALIWLTGSFAEAQEIAPERTQELAAALEASEWIDRDSGYAIIRAMASSVRITAIRLAAGGFEFSAAVQDNPDGETVRTFAERLDALIAVNGGFYGEKETGKGLFPVGLLRVDGTEYSDPWNSSGGYLVIGERSLSIVPSANGPPRHPTTLIQSKPVLIEPGGKWAMNTNQGHLRWRTIVCLLEGGDTVLVTIYGLGMSLFEAGWLMRSGEEGGFFGCDSAIAMDGGSSTQLWVRDEPELAIGDVNSVHNALLVRARSR